MKNKKNIVLLALMALLAVTQNGCRRKESDYERETKRLEQLSKMEELVNMDKGEALKQIASEKSSIDQKRKKRQLNDKGEALGFLLGILSIPLVGKGLDIFDKRKDRLVVQKSLKIQQVSEKS